MFDSVGFALADYAAPGRLHDRACELLPGRRADLAALADDPRNLFGMRRTDCGRMKVVDDRLKTEQHSVRALAH